MKSRAPAVNCIYEWNAWNGYLLKVIFPRATRIRANIGQSHRDVLAQVGRHGGWFAFHINLTDAARIPRDREKLCESLRGRGIRILNESVTTISKHTIQDACAAVGLPTTRAPMLGDPDEILILKSSYNYGGESERQLTRSERQELGLPIECTWKAGHDGYLVLPRRRIDMNRWDPTEVILERYIQNSRNFFYRAYVFLDRLVISRVVDPSRLKKMPIGIRRVNWFLTLPDLTVVRRGNPPMHVARALATFCTQIQLDFGALDVVEGEHGECYIIDVNTTPYWGDGGHPDLIAFLENGSPLALSKTSGRLQR